MRINNNIMALNAHGQLGRNQASGARSMEKLSSGLRINRAGDDAAGLAISEKMRAQIRGLNQASRNAQDAISLIQTAEGAMAETHDILQRMRELATQAATDTNVEVDRNEIQKEMNQLSSEINRIGNTTEFNTMKLMDGALSQVIHGYAKGNNEIMRSSPVNITSKAVSAQAIGTDYGAAGSRNLNATSSTFTGSAVINEFSEVRAGRNNELTIAIDGVEHALSLESNAALDSFNVLSDSVKFAAAAKWETGDITAVADDTSKTMTFNDVTFNITLGVPVATTIDYATATVNIGLANATALNDQAAAIRAAFEAYRDGANNGTNQLTNFTIGGAAAALEITGRKSEGDTNNALTVGGTLGMANAPAAQLTTEGVTGSLDVAGGIGAVHQINDIGSTNSNGLKINFGADNGSEPNDINVVYAAGAAGDAEAAFDAGSRTLTITLGAGAANNTTGLVQTAVRGALTGHVTDHDAISVTAVGGALGDVAADGSSLTSAATTANTPRAGFDHGLAESHGQYSFELIRQLEVGEIVKIGDYEFEAVATGQAVVGQSFEIGASIANTATNLAAAIAGHADWDVNTGAVGAVITIEEETGNAPSGVTLTESNIGPRNLIGTEAIVNEINNQFIANNINATASYSADSKLEIKSNTLGSTGSVSVIGGNFADSFLAEKSRNTGFVRNEATTFDNTVKAIVKGDSFSVSLQGADGNNVTIKLEADSGTLAATTAEKFKIMQHDATKEHVTDPASQKVGIDRTTKEIRAALELAIAADTNLAGRYHVTGDGNEITLTAGSAGEGHAISQFHFQQNDHLFDKFAQGELTDSTTLLGRQAVGSFSDVGYASNASNSAYVEGKDVGDVWVHDDVGASVTGSVVWTNAGLSQKSFEIDANNNELTFNIDGDTDDVTVHMDNFTYDGTSRLHATRTFEITAIQDLDTDPTHTVNFNLTGRTGEAMTIRLSAADQPRDNESTGIKGVSLTGHFEIARNRDDQVENMAAALRDVIKNNDALEGLFEVTIQNGNELTITATEATADLVVGNMTHPGTLDVTASNTVFGRHGASVETLVADMQTKVDESAYTTFSGDVTGATHMDKMLIELKGTNGDMVKLEIQARNGIDESTTQAFSMSKSSRFGDVSGDTGQAFMLARALNNAIEEDGNLRGRYEAYNDGDKLTIKATSTGSDYTIGEIKLTQDDGITEATSFRLDGASTVNVGGTTAKQFGAGTVSWENDRIVLTSNNTNAGSTVKLIGAQLADDVFGASNTRISQERLGANNELTFNLDGQETTVQIANQVYQDIHEFVAVNKQAFEDAGVTLSAENPLVLTSMATGAAGSISDIVGGDLAEQLGLGSGLTEANFIQGADGNNHLVLTVDGEEVTAVIQEGQYDDLEVLASAVQSAINTASKTAKDVTVGVEDNKLVITSFIRGSESKISVGRHDSRDASKVLGLDSATEVGGAEGSGELVFQVGANMGQSMTLRIDDMRSFALHVTGKEAGGEAGGVSGAKYTATKNVTNGTNATDVEYALDVSDHHNATAAIKVLNNAIERVSAERSMLGANQNRLENTISNLGTSAENLQAAESRVRDLDMAAEMMSMTKNNILAQAATAMLAQANMAPQAVLQLLG